MSSQQESNTESEEPPSLSHSPWALPNPTHNQVSTVPTPEPHRGAAPLPAEGFVVSDRSRDFLNRVFPEASESDWNDWKWQLRHRFSDTRGLEQIVRLSKSEKRAIERTGGRLPLGITPFYASLMDPVDPEEPIRRMMIPVATELVRGPGEADDPLDESGHSPVPGLVHRYPDRVLLMVTNFCATYCRYCTRARLVGHTGDCHFSTSDYQAAINYISSHSEVRDVVLSGGDPLTMAEGRLEWILSRLREIRHVELLRIGTKIPVVLPQRITPELTRMLSRYHPLWMSLHFMHPKELTSEVAQSCERLADAGIPTGSQTVLISGVNDDVETMRRLVHGLLRVRVRPYYLYQCDPISGSAHLRTPLQKGLEIVAGLRGHTTGYACPTFVVDGPGGAGKIALLPEAIVGREGNDVLLRNHQGLVARYPDPLRPRRRRRPARAA